MPPGRKQDRQEARPSSRVGVLAHVSRVDLSRRQSRHTETVLAQCRNHGLILQQQAD